MPEKKSKQFARVDGVAFHQEGGQRPGVLMGILQFVAVDDPTKATGTSTARRSPPSSRSSCKWRRKSSPKLESRQVGFAVTSAFGSQAAYAAKAAAASTSSPRFETAPDDSKAKAEVRSRHVSPPADPSAAVRFDGPLSAGRGSGCGLRSAKASVSGSSIPTTANVFTRLYSLPSSSWRSVSFTWQRIPGGSGRSSGVQVRHPELAKVPLRHGPGGRRQPNIVPETAAGEVAFEDLEDELITRRALRLAVERFAGDNVSDVFARRQRREVFGGLTFRPMPSR